MNNRVTDMHRKIERNQPRSRSGECTRFNMSEWGDPLREDARWKYGVPTAGNANYAWVDFARLSRLAISIATKLKGFILQQAPAFHKLNNSITVWR